MNALYCVRIDASGPVVRPCVVTSQHDDGTADVIIFDAAAGVSARPVLAAPRGDAKTPGWYPAGDVAAAKATRAARKR